MKFDFFTLFPSLYEPFLSESLLGKASQKGILQFRVFNIRDFSPDPHRKVDDYSYGGGTGMVLRVDVVINAIRRVYGSEKALVDEVRAGKTAVVVPSARGVRFEQSLAWELSKKGRIVFVAPRYEGVDQRVVEILNAVEISVGDYVVMGGDVPAMLITEAVARLVPGVVGKGESVRNESFSGDGLLEYPQYTRPYDFDGYTVPGILLSGDHLAVDRWRRRQAILTTYRNRPDLLIKLLLNGKISIDEIREALSRG